MDVPTIETRMNSTRTLPPNDIEDLVSSVIPPERLPVHYLRQLSEIDRTTANRAVLLAWTVTNGAQVPREMQLKATLASYNKQDSIIHAGTGSGKTLAVALNVLLDDPKASHITRARLR